MTRFIVIAIALSLSAGAAAQNTVHTETFRPPPKADGGPDIITDLSQLPSPIARKRDQILTAARSGELDRLVAVMKAEPAMPVFSLADGSDPIVYWKANYPDSDGVEVLSILVSILEAGFVHVDVGTAQEMYIWPYFARMPLKSLTAPQRVALFRIVTGADYKDMLESGAYSFYRLGIGSNSTWHYFISGD